MSSDLAGRDHWDSRGFAVARRLPSKLNVFVADMTRLFARHVRPGDAVLEVGCAPGKFLLWCALAAGARASGVEYAPKSAEATRSLFSDMHVPLDLRVEDFMETSLPDGSFDVVYSIGLIEHFDDPRPMVRRHVEMLKPGGKAIIIVPDYGGLYGKIQGRLDPENLAIHNLKIMDLKPLRDLAPADLASEIKTYRWGRLTPWILSIDKHLPGPLARATSLSLNLLGLLQPVTIDKFAPWLVLEITRR